MWNIVASVLSYDVWFYISREIIQVHRIQQVANAEELRWVDPGDMMIQHVGAIFPFFIYTYTVLDVIIILLIVYL
jgi:hypothetical protein